jgi:hypothetical protein
VGSIIKLMRKEKELWISGIRLWILILSFTLRHTGIHT